MIRLVSTFVFVCLVMISRAQVVSIEMPKEKMTMGEPIAFSVKCLSEQDLELTIFSGDCLVIQQKCTLSPDSHPFNFPVNPCAPGKYFILITGNGIHVEKEFVIQK